MGRTHLIRPRLKRLFAIAIASGVAAAISMIAIEIWVRSAWDDTRGRPGFFISDAVLGQAGWYKDNAAMKTHPVGQKHPNAWGLYDMHGNVYEWVQDWYAEGYYKQRPNPDSDPQGPEIGETRVLRGGGCWDYQRLARCTARYGLYPNGRAGSGGFRIVVRP